MSDRKLIVAGGGAEADSAPLDEKFAAWVGSAGKMLYLPVAMDGQNPSYEMCLQWVKRTFRPFNISNIEMWTNLVPGRLDELEYFKAIYIGGGNTFRLLHLFRLSGFDTTLINFMKGGSAVYGGSAGAILLGRDIMTCAHMDPNDVGLGNTTGLDVVNGYAVWCHYRLEDDARIAHFVEEYNLAVLALSERSGICIENEQLLVLGYEGVRKFTGNGKQYIEVGKLCD
jgi:dipeptidase E